MLLIWAPAAQNLVSSSHLQQQYHPFQLGVLAPPTTCDRVLSFASNLGVFPAQQLVHHLTQ